eukprot:m.280206 g.280206  ORF g.280206 m.280206 type:complete len:104 (+) comp17732_c0_seq1:608-919(+)
MLSMSTCTGGRVKLGTSGSGGRSNKAVVSTTVQEDSLLSALSQRLNLQGLDDSSFPLTGSESPVGDCEPLKPKRGDDCALTAIDVRCDSAGVAAAAARSQCST